MQQVTRLDGLLLKSMLIGGFCCIKYNVQRINGLNVFPVPDGDTGTNMKMTVEGGIKSVMNDDIASVGELLRLFSRGALLGARGNSGIILSQYFKGISLFAEQYDTLDMALFTDALDVGVGKAYESVINPVEGTILTVMRESAAEIRQRLPEIKHFHEYFELLNDSMRRSLMNTPNLLSVLKDAGVIDSGGAGLLAVFEGMEKVLHDGLLEGWADDASLWDSQLPQNASSVGFNADSELEYGYCTEFILQLMNRKVDINSFDISTIVAFLEDVGNSIVALKEGDLVKIHVHTFTPGKVIEFCQQFGEFYSLKIENMSVQHNETIVEEVPERKKYAVAAVCTGSGIISYFESIGADCVINGGSTFNPSVEDYTKAYESLNAEYIIVLPNNRNAILAAQQSASLYKKADVRIVETASIAEGYSALSMMDLTKPDIDSVLDDMKDAVRGVSTGVVTYAVRDVDFHGLKVNKGDFIGLGDSDILSASSDRSAAFIGLLNKTEGIEDKEVVTAFYGSDVTEEEIADLTVRLKADFPLVEFGFICGNMELYSYILAIE